MQIFCYLISDLDTTRNENERDYDYVLCFNCEGTTSKPLTVGNNGYMKIFPDFLKSETALKQIIYYEDVIKKRNISFPLEYDFIFSHIL